MWAARWSTSGDRTLSPRSASYLHGRSGADVLIDQGPDDILQGGSEDDTIEAHAGSNFLLGDAGADTLRGGEGADILAGGAGADRIATGDGRDVLLFRRGDGADRVDASRGSGHILSVGGGVRLEDFRATREGDALRLGLGGGDEVLLEDWYAAGPARHVTTLQWWRPTTGVIETLSDGSVAREVEWFDLTALARDIDANASAAMPVGGSLADALARAHMGGSDAEAFGGDLAWAHANQTSLAGTPLSAVKHVLAETGVSEGPSDLTRPRKQLFAGSALVG